MGFSGFRWLGGFGLRGFRRFSGFRLSGLGWFSGFRRFSGAGAEVIGFAGGGIPGEGDGFDNFREEEVAGGEGELGGPALGAEGGVGFGGLDAGDGGMDKSGGVGIGETLEIFRGDAGLEAAARHGGGEQGDAVLVDDVFREVAANAPVKPVVAHGFNWVAAADEPLDGFAEDFDEFFFGHEFVFGKGEGEVVGGSEGVGDLVGEPGGFEGGAGLVLGAEGLDEVVVVGVDVGEKGGALVISEDMGGIIDVGTLALETVGAAHALEMEDFFAAGEILAAGEELS